MSAFFTGWFAVSAICCGLEWLKDRDPFHVIAFWLNLIVMGLNAFFWLIY